MDFEACALGKTKHKVPMLLKNSVVFFVTRNGQEMRDIRTNANEAF